MGSPDFGINDALTVKLWSRTLSLDVAPSANGRALEVGDVVQFLSGGPLMAIVNPRTSYWGGGSVVCQFFRGDELTRLEVDPKLLFWIENPKVARPIKAKTNGKRRAKAL